jgi:hypothetical protein
MSADYRELNAWIYIDEMLIVWLGQMGDWLDKWLEWQSPNHAMQVLHAAAATNTQWTIGMKSAFIS